MPKSPPPHIRIYRDLECLDVRRMHDKFNFDHCNTPTLPFDNQDMLDRVVMMREEVGEFEKAAIEENLPKMADALIDLVYFTKGTAVILGLPWGTLWDDVHACNMAKTPGEKKGREGIRQDLIKPPGWKPPRTEEILAERRTEAYAERRLAMENQNVKTTITDPDS